ncbi:hypothetical protein GQ53DRAFT_787495 [Thozetella sp. PMI_491]|nr:hypothetical protein GQ53DRAFT_787495 [Thozetella sp. PMI_491]
MAASAAASISLGSMMPILQFEDRQEWRLSGPQHPWNLAPSKELDAAWDELLYGLNIRVTPSEVRRLNDTLTNPIRVENGDYLAGLGVFHHLHCLNNIRKALQRDYYAPEIASSSHPEAWEAGHSDHCINAIRESLMCHANTAAYMIEWAEDPHAFLGIQLTSSAVTTCVNWDSLNSWARKRALVKGTFKLQPPLKESTHN